MRYRTQGAHKHTRHVYLLRMYADAQPPHVALVLTPSAHMLEPNAWRLSHGSCEGVYMYTPFGASTHSQYEPFLLRAGPEWVGCYSTLCVLGHDGCWASGTRRGNLHP